MQGEGSNLASVDLVEDLHEDKDVEDHGVVLRVVGAARVRFLAEVVWPQGLAGGRVEGRWVRRVVRRDAHACRHIERQRERERTRTRESESEQASKRARQREPDRNRRERPA